jgi:hypothetical protein
MKHHNTPESERDAANSSDVREESGSRPISRVLSRTIIHLGCLSPDTSSNLPGSSAGHTLRPTLQWSDCLPIWSCSEWGLPCRRVLPLTRCALTAPFHPYRLPLPDPHPASGRGEKKKLRRFALCCTFRRLTPPRCYLALCPMEPGLSSTRLLRGLQRLSGRLPARMVQMPP